MFDQMDIKEIDITQEPPMEEPDRQKFFIAKGRKYVETMVQKLNRPLVAVITTFGCQMNAKDSEKLEGILIQMGFEIGQNEEDGDFVIFNTCTVRENANLKVYGRLGQLKSWKKKFPHKMIGLCGCMMQEQVVVEKLKKSYRYVDLIFGTHNIYRFAEILVERFETGSMVIDVWEKADQIVEDLPTQRKYPFKSGVNIMFGCNNFCSYCIVPHVRGRERSRTPEAIVKEIETLVADGVVEVMLLGQNVNSYGKTLETPVSFAELLKKIEKIEGLKRIRFMTSHPKDLSQDLIDVMATSTKICKHLHLPVQSGSSQILQKMNRRYTKESYLDLVQRIREKNPEISLTTDIIVGFPGETEEDFQETLDVVRQVRYDSAFTFLYSKRTGTPAAEYVNQVPETVMKERFQRLLKEVQTISREVCSVHEGKEVEVLVESVSEQDSEMITGRMSNNLLVHFKGSKESIGSMKKVRLTQCKGFYYFGEVI